ncbi:unnamed protein product [Mytilus coruscus]|uniref:EGF-like domain-containing protein n=1 Tax=Mytilus coruscus TaxID=42192 RepID=A0A6J8BXL3_MYTCO|nr:unnamed protein product [Mytilus coruscus]
MMATAQQNVYTNTSFNAAETNPDYEEEFAEYDEITFVQTEDSTNDCNTTIPNIPLPRQADIYGRPKIQMSLWLLFTIFFLFLIAIVITGVVTFFITKERFTEKHLSVCDSNPCSNGGLCQVKGAKYKCTCDPGFSGDQCDVGVCSSSPCRNGGICKVVRENYSCKCLSGYSGQQCEDSGYFDYVIMFTEPPRDVNIPRLYIRSSKSGSVSIYSKADKARAVTLNSGTNQVDLLKSVFTQDGISDNAIHVNSTVPIVLYGFVTDTAVDGYLAIPSSMLGDKYIVPTYKPSKTRISGNVCSASLV